MQYPSNWERDTFNNKVAFFAPSLEERNKEIIPAAVFVHVYRIQIGCLYYAFPGDLSRLPDFSICR